ncbi:hypothetical protein C4D60_Mb05t13300 [Musa balbisiana]|uniref:Uncharacterized protein n=1 Tax=Musa balbisiana TaxID=52838 RepID=A0A4S8JVV7_MUSBA|nr:hypothetical protein C4D60_Mb05t13300 [Musa balbisiana]
MLKLIQLGLTFSDEFGNLPTCGTDRGCVWQFNFREFDMQLDVFATDSIELLRQSGIDFKKNNDKGIDAHRFGELLMSSGIVLNDSIYWVTFHSGYDFGYLLKVLTCQNLPDTQAGFFNLIRIYFPTVYDIKHLMKFCNSLHGGLNKLAELLDVERVGICHQAGSDSLLTSCAFRKLKESFFSGSTERYAGVLYGLSTLRMGVLRLTWDSVLFNRTGQRETISRPGAAPQEGNKGDEICSDVSFPQTTASSFDPTHPTEAEEHVDRGMPIPCGSSVLHATPVAMSDATRGTVLPLQAATSGNIKLIYKYPRVLNELEGGETTQEHLQNHPLHIANLIVGGVGPSPRPDLCAGARRCRLSLALRRSFLPTRPADPTSRPDPNHRARPPRDLEGRHPRSPTSGPPNRAASAPRPRLKQGTPSPPLCGQLACVVLLGSSAACLPETTPARPARLRRAPRQHVARDHACAACPPAPCSSVARCPRPRLRGLPACAVFLVTRCPRPQHLRGQPVCVVLLGYMLPETTPARPARLRRVPRSHVAQGRNTCAACPACVVFLVSMAFETHLRGQPVCVVLLDPMTRDTPQPACVVLLGSSAPRLLGCMPPRDHTCAASPSASCSSAPRLHASQRPHLRGLPACAVFLGHTLPKAATPARPARLRRVPRSHVAQGRNTCAACPPAPCSSVTRCPRPQHLRGLPACAVFLGHTLPKAATPARPARLRRAPRLLGSSAACLPETTPARPARLRRVPRSHVAQGRNTCAASPSASCSSATCCPRPRLRGLPACAVFLGHTLPKAATPARPARLRRAPRQHVARDHACAACPPAPCSSVTRCPRPQHLRGLPACAVFLGHTLPKAATPARPARLRRVPRSHVAQGRNTCAASPSASCSSAPRLLGCMPPRDHTCAACPPAPCSSVTRCPRPQHLRGQPVCVVLLGNMLPETTPARPARLRRVPRSHVAQGRNTCAASPSASCSSATCCPRPRLRGLPACAVFLGHTLPKAATPARPARLRRAPRILGCMPPRDHTCAACPPAPCSSVTRCPRPQHLRGQPVCVVLLGNMLPETTPARPARLRRVPRSHVAQGRNSSAPCSSRPRPRGQPPKDRSHASDSPCTTTDA